MWRLLLSLLLIEQVYCEQTALDAKKTFNYDIYKYDNIITVTVNNNTQQILDFKEDDSKWSGFPTRVYVSTNDTLSPDYPIFITATQQKGVSSWELPLALVASDTDTHLTFDNMERTLCPHDADGDKHDHPTSGLKYIKSISPPTVHITTESAMNTSVDIKVQRVTDFYVQLDKEVSLNVTPSTPKYYHFSFDQNPWNLSDYDRNLKRIPIPTFNYTIPKNVVIIIESSDDICAVVSIQNNSCPVFDNEQDVTFQGYYLTMMTKGGITLTQTMFPHGFYIVFIVKESDVECTGVSETVARYNRTKQFTFRILPSVSYKQYAVGALLVMAVVTLVAAFVIAANYLHHGDVPIEMEPIPSTSRDDSEQAPIVNITEESWSSPQALTVGRLTQAPPDTIARRSNRYFWGALTVAVVYSLPVVQLLYTYQKLALTTGDQDVCYYNFLCAHSLWGMTDFNHVFSNLPYLMLGAVFLVQVRLRQKRNTNKQGVGIPQHYGLLYSMGLALIMEGSLSACYHLCPNKMNFQFDSSFMYVIAVLVMIKLYQNRHSDLVPSAHSTFMVIAIIMSIGVIGILFPSTYFSVLFTILHLGTCFVLTLKIYYAGRFSIDHMVSQLWASCRGRGGWRSLIPAHRARAVLLALANVANWTFAIYCALEHNKDLARQLLAILMGNAILYTIFYIVMKLVHRERIPVHAWIYIILSHAAWFTALYFFTHGNTKWSETPAMSRAHNGVCSTLGVFDSHDLWHVTSSAAMFLSFNMLMSIDDDVTLHNTPRHNIVTF